MAILQHFLKSLQLWFIYSELHVSKCRRSHQPSDAEKMNGQYWTLYCHLLRCETSPHVGRYSIHHILLAWSLFSNEYSKQIWEFNATCQFCQLGLEPQFNNHIWNYCCLYHSIMDINYDNFYSWQRHILQSAALVVDSITKSTLSLLSQAFPLTVRYPYHTSILTGEGWVLELLTGHPWQIQTELGVSHHVLSNSLSLCDLWG
jgi:hypothetical protein